MKKCDVGGQAVIEGVMMRGAKGLATAIRKENGDIEVKSEIKIPINRKNKIFNLPFVRGVLILIDSLITGINTINYSASFFEDLEESKFETWLRNKFGNKANDVIIGITLCVSLTLAAVLFLLIPTAIASIFQKMGLGNLALNVIEVIIRVTILVGYIYLISKMEDIYRVFQYHGAEHKTIACYEAEEELTVENVKKYSRLHPRCGTNFLFLIMIVSIMIFALTGWGGIVQRLLSRLILIPIVAGITYEIIKWLGKTDSKLGKILSWPGLQLQRLTTKEPDEDQIEVAIESLLAAEGIELTIGALLVYGNKKLKGANIDTYLLDSQVLLSYVLDKDKIYIITNKSEKISNELKLKYINLINRRVKNTPVAYLMNKVEFMGLEFNVQKGVLIPRGDTEILVEEVLKEIEVESDYKICDLCCGSGAIGISLANYRNNIIVDMYDLYDKPGKISNSNINKHGLKDRVNFIKSDLLKAAGNKKYNIIVSNPPYIPEKVIETLMDDVKKYEPHTALVGGEDGLIFYRRITEASKEHLEGNGILAFEIGHDQGVDVSEIMKGNGFENIRVIKDLANHDRVVIGYLKVDK